MNPGSKSEIATPRMLQRFRAEFHLTQKELRELLGLQKQTLSRWERGAQRTGHPRVLYLALQTLRGRLLRHKRPRPRPDA